LLDFRFGSKADVTLLNFDVRFTPESGHSPTRSGCLLWAISDILHRRKTASLFAVSDEPSFGIRCRERGVFHHIITGHCRLIWFHVDLLLDDDWERKRKRRALARLRLDPDFTAVHLDNALRNGEPQAGAALLAGDGIVGLLELLKQLGLIGSGDTGASVTDRYIE
jgi:hypothetical protein